MQSSQQKKAGRGQAGGRQRNAGDGRGPAEASRKHEVVPRRVADRRAVEIVAECEIEVELLRETVAHLNVEVKARPATTGKTLVERDFIDQIEIVTKQLISVPHSVQDHLWTV